jgi:hypothetical protein
VASDQAAINFEANVVCVVRTSQRIVATPLFLIGEGVEVVEKLFPFAAIKIK